MKRSRGNQVSTARAIRIDRVKKKRKHQLTEIMLAHTVHRGYQWHDCNAQNMHPKLSMCLCGRIVTEYLLIISSLYAHDCL